MLRRLPSGRRENYNLQIDWFSFGCVIYEFICGVSPFRTAKAKHFQGIRDREMAMDMAVQEMEPEFDEKFDEKSVDLISKLLEKNPRKRLGARSYYEIVRHPWFEEIDFERLETIPPPFVPSAQLNILSQGDIGGFSNDKEIKKLELTEQEVKQYDGWAYSQADSFQEEVLDFLIRKAGTVKNYISYLNKYY